LKGNQPGCAAAVFSIVAHQIHWKYWLFCLSTQRLKQRDNSVKQRQEQQRGASKISRRVIGRAAGFHSGAYQVWESKSYICGFVKNK
jgi:hypothetical protein